MIVYWSACLLSVMLATIFTSRNKLNYGKGKKTKGKVFLTGLPLFIVSAIRYDVGTDYWSYYSIFENLKAGGSSGVEVGFTALNYFVVYTFGNFEWLVAICAALFVYLILSEIYEESKIVPLSVFLMMGTLQYFFSLTNIRQMIGCAILFYSIRYIKLNEAKKFIICVLIASTMHISCIVFLAVYFVLNKVKIQPTQGLLISLTIILMRQQISQIVRWIMSLTRFSSYLGSEIWDIGDTSYAIMAVQGAVLVLAVIFQNKKDKIYNASLNMQYASFWISLCGGIIPQIQRIQRIFGIIAILLIPSALSSVKNKKARLILIFAIVIFYALYVTISIGVNNQVKALPYQTIFNK